MKLGATVAIIEDQKILLTKRSDFEVWCLPGGHTDEGESVAETAVREAKEEIGVDVELARYVGVYSRLGGDSTIHLHLFNAKVIGGGIKPQPEEVLDIQFFALDNLPEHMFWWHRQMIVDAFSDVTGAAWEFEVVPAVEVADRQALYALQAEMKLPPVKFYQYFFESNGTHRVKKWI